MRLLTLLGLVLTALALSGAAFLGPPYWLWALWAVPLLATLTAVGLAVSLLELLLGPRVRSVAPALAAALALFAGLYALFEQAPGTFPTEPLLLRDLGAKALSICALGADLAALGLGAYGLRAPGRPAQLLAVAALAGAVLTLGTAAAAFGLPRLSPWLRGTLGAAGGLLVLGCGARERQEEAEPDEQ
jgi:hypothetical protein